MLESLICRIMVGANATCNALMSNTESSGVSVRHRSGEKFLIQYEVILQNLYDHHMSLNKRVLRDRVNPYKRILKIHQSMSRCRLTPYIKSNLYTPDFYDNCTNIIHFPKKCMQREKAVTFLMKSIRIESQFFPTFFDSEEGQISFFSSVNKTITSSDFCWPEWKTALALLKLAKLEI